MHNLLPSPLSDSIEDELELSTVRHRPEGLEQLEAQTRFSRKELQILYRGFKNVSNVRYTMWLVRWEQVLALFSFLNRISFDIFFFQHIRWWLLTFWHQPANEAIACYRHHI